jgi:diguanylate cyclase (GGDEF)-like protein/PAS domain S-box-containing protein
MSLFSSKKERLDGSRTDDSVESLIAAVPLPACITSHAGGITGCNSGFERLINLTSAEILGTNIGDYLEPEDAPSQGALLAEIANGTRRDYTTHTRWKRSGRDPIWTRIVGFEARGAGGIEPRVVTLIEDVDEKVIGDAHPHGTDLALRMQAAAALAFVNSESMDLVGPDVLEAIGLAGDWAAGIYWQVEIETACLRAAGVWHQPATAIPRMDAHVQKYGLALGEELPGTAWQTAEVQWQPSLDAGDDSLRIMKAVDEGMRCVVAVPIRSSGEVVGVLELFGAEARAPSDRARIALSSIGEQVGRQLERLSAESALRASEEHYRGVTERATDAVISIDSKGTILSANQAAEAMFGYSRTELVGHSLTMLMPESLRVGHEAGLRRYRETGRRNMSWEKVDLQGLRKDGREISLQASLAELSVGKDRIFTGWIRDVTLARRQESELVHQAMHDSLTQLPNRSLLQDRLSRAVLVGHRHKQPLALLFMDLDGFKDVNDTFGHYCGDLLLQQVARRLEHVLRESDSVARLGGDEFAMLLPSTDESGAVLATQRLLAALHEPFSVEGKDFAISASVGIAMFPDHGDDVLSLMRLADVAMYAAKRAASGHAVYDEERDSHGSLRLVRIVELRSGIEANQLVLHYQPKVNLRDGRTEDVEALVRWVHPERGMVPPDDFIPLAEESGLMKDLTVWVLNEALRQHKRWREDGLDLRIAVNFSAGMLQDEGLPALVKGLLEQWSVDPGRLEIEITESAFMETPQRARDTVRELHAMGIWISIDDFGTGYSSLGYLKHLRVDEVKVDRSFVIDMDSNREDEPIVRSVVNLGHNFGLRVVAEGVDNRRTIDMLRSMGCDVAQGFYLSRPLAADALVEWLADSRGGLALVS